MIVIFVGVPAKDVLEFVPEGCLVGPMTLVKHGKNKRPFRYRVQDALMEYGLDLFGYDLLGWDDQYVGIAASHLRLGIHTMPDAPDHIVDQVRTRVARLGLRQADPQVYIMEE